LVDNTRLTGPEKPVEIEERHELNRDTGWVKIHRAILTSGYTAEQFKFFVSAILLAEPLRSKHPGRVTLPLRRLSDEIGMSYATVFKVEKELAERGDIIIHRHPGRGHEGDQGFTISNYEKYQGKGSHQATENDIRGEQNDMPREHSGKKNDIRGEQNDMPREQNDIRGEQNDMPREHSTPSFVPTKNIKNIKNIKEEYIYLPDWLDKVAWNDFLEMRKNNKATPTKRAKELLIKDLEKFREAGDDPTEVLNQSIKNSWKGLFPLKEKQNAGINQNQRNNQARSGVGHLKTTEELLAGNAKYDHEHGYV